MAWTLSSLREEVRQITGFVSTSQISDSDINLFINRFYQNTLPSELNLPALTDFWEFNTSKNVDVYANLSSNYSLDNPATINGFEALIYTDAATFYSDFPQFYDRTNIATGNGVTTNYTGTLTSLSVYAAVGVTITDSVETFVYTSPQSIRTSPCVIGLYPSLPPLQKKILVSSFFFTIRPKTSSFFAMISSFLRRDVHNVHACSTPSDLSTL